MGGSCWPTGATGPQGRPVPGQDRFLKRQLSLPVSMISQWWVRRSRSAVVIFGSPKTDGHSPKARFVVIMWNQGSSFRGLFCRTVLRAQLGRSLA